MVSYCYRSLRDATTARVDSVRKGAWAFVHELAEEDIRHLINTHGIDTGILEDAVDYFEVPRFERVNEINYLFTRYPVNTKDGELSTAPLLIAITSDNVLTLTHRKAEFLDDIAHGRNPVVTTQKVRFVLHVMEAVIKQYSRSLMNIRREMLRYFGNLDQVTQKGIERFVGLESTVTDYTSALGPTLTALRQMLSEKHVSLHEEDVDQIEDLIQDITQLIESGRNTAKTIVNIRNAQSTLLTNQLNNTIRQLTALTIILTVPTIIASLFGMNTWLPGGNTPLAFFSVIFIIGLSVGVVSWVFYKKRWFEN